VQDPVLVPNLNEVATSMVRGRALIGMGSKPRELMVPFREAGPLRARRGVEDLLYDFVGARALPLQAATTKPGPLTIDSQGNPYFGFANNLSSNPATCSAESTAGTVQSDTSCEYDMYVVWSSNGGSTWDGGGGLIPGSAATAYRVNAPSESGTHWFPAITAGDPGKVDVAYLRTTEILPTDAFGKADAGGCAGPGPANGNPTTYPPPCPWNLFAAQSLNLTSSPGRATWAVSQVTTTPMHIGDICNLGIFCVAPSSNRHLLDFIQDAVDPSGCAHISYADDNTVNLLRAANQTSGVGIIGNAGTSCHR